MSELKESDRKIYEIPMDDIFCDDAFNCRGKVAPIDVINLVQSIEKDGLQVPIAVQPYTLKPGKKFRIIAGHRRYVAFKVLKKQTIPTTVLENLTEIQAHTFNLTENIERQELNKLQEANALKIYKDAGMTQDEVAKEIKMSRGWVQLRYYILDFVPEIQTVVAAGLLTDAHIIQVHSLSPVKQLEAVKILKEFREKGNKKAVRIVPKKVNPFLRKARDRHEIFEMQSIVREAVGNNLATRALAWAAGEISTFDLHRDLKETAQSMGKDYAIPSEILKQA